jgi:hypothetical protein
MNIFCPEGLWSVSEGGLDCKPTRAGHWDDRGTCPILKPLSGTTRPALARPQ